MRVKRLFWGFLFVLLLAGYASAQNELPNDTLRIQEVYATPSEQGVRVAVNMRNTINVAGFTLRMAFDSTLITPKYTQQDGQRVLVAYRTYRTPYELMPNFGGTIPQSGIMTFLCATDWFDLPIKYIPAQGNGPVVEFEFDVNPAIQQDTVANIVFSPHPTLPYTYNNFSDELGDLYFPELHNGRIIITTEGPGNKAPVFDPLSSPYTVDEGDSLAFTVRAIDPDGDGLTLYAETVLPNHATFPTKSGKPFVIQNFVFKPDYTQGGVNYSVTFAARDDSNKIAKTSVTIIVNDVPQIFDLLTVSDAEGGVPGAKDIPVPITLINSQDVFGIQFTLGWNDSVLDVDSIKLSPSFSHFSLRDNLGDVSSQVTVLLFSLDNQSILAGTEEIVEVFVSVDSVVCGLDALLTLSDATEAINFPHVESRELTTEDGSFYVDCFGDVTLDKLIDVADVVSLVGYILGNVEYDARKEGAADVNGDETIDVIDLQAIINIILGRPIGAPGIGLSAPLAIVDLDLENLKKGSDTRILVHSEHLVPVAGVQLKLRYDPNQMSFSPPVTTDLTNDFIVQYKDEGKGKITLVMYNMAGKSIESGEGNILSLPVVLKTGLKDDPQVEIEEVIMADPEAVGIPVGKKGAHLPVDFKLAQNYPNPFNPSTTIEFEILTDVRNEVMVHTTLKIYNVLGRRIKTLVDEMKTVGNYQVIWDGTDDSGERVSSGVYFYQLKAKDYQETKKMVLMK